MEFDQLIIWLMSFGPVIIPVFTFLGADHAMFAMILANDMGGYPLAMELAQSEQA